MRDSKTSSFSPVVVKQEPADPSETDGCSSPRGSTPPGKSSSHSTALEQAMAVDLRAAPPQRGAGGRPYDSTEDLVAQIARRVREESGLELTPVTGLGPLADLKAPPPPPPGLPPLFAGPSSVENGGKSRGEYACGECSSRFDTARDYRAHCLTHQVLKAESMLRSSRGGSREREGVRGVEVEEEDPPGAVYGGLSAGGEAVVSFTCEDCNARFSSRDTYAMHMLIRAKNEACFPAQPLLAPCTSLSTKPATDTSPDSSSTLPPLSPAPSSHLPSALLMGAAPTSDLQLEGGGAKGEGGKKGEGEGERRGDIPPSFLHTLGLDLGHVTGYGAAWWSKYMPWMTGLGVGGMVGAEGEGPALPMVCYLCGELFSSRDALAMHVLFHTRDVPASLADPAPSWKKPRPHLPPSLPTTSSPAAVLTPSSSSTSSPSALLLGHAAALRQLQQRGHYNGHSGQLAPTSSLSPTEAVVASAAAAAVAAITPPHSQGALCRGPGRAGTSPFTATARTSTGRGQEAVFSLPRDKGGAIDQDPPLHLSPPQRGASAPIPTATPTSPPQPGSDGDTTTTTTFRSAADTKTLANARPLSADHVVLRHHRPLFLPPSPGAERRHSGEHVTSAGWSSDKASVKADGGWRSGSDTSVPHSSAFNVYRLQRLKKLRLAKGPYRRPGARGRPPMTILGTVGRRPLGGQPPALTASLPIPSHPSVGSMLQLLTSQGHVVSACSHCELLFGDKTLYQLHMGLHNVNNPWQCNACGCVCSSRLHFATHTLHY
ncbi:uncharacterized protein LOC143284984 [Babylonia areolata]|uniref:uncharacterized protein LOC143284984 n=1 Tax=Babylonia areolata TaxID=304850 RepID=UPI003FD374BE